MLGGEGEGVGGVPVLGGDFEGEGEGEQVVDDGGEGAAGGDAEGAGLEGGWVSWVAFVSMGIWTCERVAGWGKKI